MGRGQLLALALLAGAALLVTPTAAADPPTLSGVPSGLTVEATSSAGAVVTWTDPTATDGEGNDTTVECSPASGSTFPLGSTTVTCVATDVVTNDTTSASFTVTVVDTTAPAVTVPGTVTAEATGPSGASVTFSASATDAVSGSLTPSCSPASGSTFPLGSTTVTCIATDGAGNTGSASFTVTVVDTTPPSLTGVPASRRVEADSAAGSRVGYALPTASDTVSGPLPVVCSPASGSLFPLGSTFVRCSATDGSGNTGSATFIVTVADTTPPTLNVPKPTTISTGGARQLPSSAAPVRAFLGAATARDLVDGVVAVENDAPTVLSLGTTSITFSAKDKAGNVATRRSQITLTRFGSVPPSVVDRTPPGDVRNVVARPGDRSVELSWTLPSDAASVEITRSPGRGRQARSLVFSALASRYRDRGLTNGVEYRYVVVAVDAAGNRSGGVAIRATPRKLFLVAPPDGATVTAPPVLRWLEVPRATYYNVQVYRLGGKGRGPTKILSAWPSRPPLRLQRSWVFEGKRQRLTPGRYAWFVWPGFGSRGAALYGELLGRSTFVVVTP